MDERTSTRAKFMCNRKKLSGHARNHGSSGERRFPATISLSDSIGTRPAGFAFCRRTLFFVGCWFACFAAIQWEAHGIVGYVKPTVPELPTELQTKWGNLSETELKQAADKGNAEAEFVYGVQELGRAEADHRRANAWLFRAVSNGENLSESEERAARNKWDRASETELRKAAEAGERGAQWFLGEQGASQAAKRGRKAIDWIKKAADHSQPTAAFELAEFYLGEKGWMIVPVNVAEGMRWLNRAAELRVEAAQHKLADVYLAGGLVPSDPVAAVGWLQKAVDQGCRRAQFELACQYANGNGEPRSTAESPTGLMILSATNGYVPAIEAMAGRYRSGFGVSPDYVRAVRWYRVAADVASREDWGNMSHAQEMLGIIDERLEPRREVSPEYQSFAEVMSLYLKAMTRNDAEACFRIGELYRRGRFEPVAPVEACRWYLMATKAGHAAATNALSEMQKSMTPEDFELASRKGPILSELPKPPQSR